MVIYPSRIFLLLLLIANTALAQQPSEPSFSGESADEGEEQKQQTIWDRTQLHGFASQAVIRTSDNRWFGDSPDTSFDFTEIGLNASMRVSPAFLLSGQVLYRRAGEMAENQVSLDYGLIDITPLSSAEGRLGVRLGRVKNPLGLYNETRDVPFTHPGIFLPQTVYYDQVRNLMLSTDGAMLYGEHYSNYGNITAYLGGGWPALDDNVEWSFFAGDYPGELENDDIGWVASVWYTDPSERIKLGLSGAKFSLKFKPNTPLAMTLEPGNTDLDLWIASAQYNSEKWTLTTEYTRRPTEWSGYGPLFPDLKSTGEGWYVQGIYKLLPSIEWLLCYEEGYPDVDDRDGKKFSAASGGLVSPSYGFSKILTTGLRWDINEHWMVRGEYAYHNGTFITLGSGKSRSQ
jgi:hypothetical protein